MSQIKNAVIAATRIPMLETLKHELENLKHNLIEKRHQQYSDGEIYSVNVKMYEYKGPSDMNDIKKMIDEDEYLSKFKRHLLIELEDNDPFYCKSNWLEWWLEGERECLLEQYKKPEIDINYYKKALESARESEENFFQIQHWCSSRKEIVDVIYPKKFYVDLCRQQLKREIRRKEATNILDENSIGFYGRSGGYFGFNSSSDHEENIEQTIEEIADEILNLKYLTESDSDEVYEDDGFYRSARQVKHQIKIEQFLIQTVLDEVKEMHEGMDFTEGAHFRLTELVEQNIYPRYLQLKKQRNSPKGKAA